MRAHQIMTRPVITVTPETTIVEAANIMLQRHVSGLPVINAARQVVFLVTGEDKADAVARAFEAEPTFDTPASLVTPVLGRLVALLDRAAASRLRELA